MKVFYPFDRVVWGFLKLNCMNCLYVLDINPLSVISFANILFYSVGCLFVDGFHCYAKNLLRLIRLFVFTFISFALGNRYKVAKQPTDLMRSLSKYL